VPRVAELPAALAAIDAETVPLQQVARRNRWRAAERPAPTPAQEARILAMERRLAAVHGHAFRALKWHGRTSLQRIVWQDAEVMTALASEDLARAVLSRVGSELDLGGGTTLSGALMGGVSINRPSYLLTVCPNWRLRPRADGVAFDRLSDMSVPDAEQLQPWMVCPLFLCRGAEALASLQRVVARDGPGESEEERTTRGLWCAVDESTTASVFAAVPALLDERRARLLVDDPDNPSTALERMNGQCLEVMASYADLVRAHGGRHERALGFGLVSHALDAKHLLAALVFGLGLGHIHNPHVDGDRAVRALRELMEGAVSGAVGSVAATLLRVRAWQILRLIVDHRARLELSAPDIVRALGPAVTSS